MALRNGFPAVSGAANFLDIRRDIAALVARDTTGKIRAGVFPRHYNSLLTARADMKVDVAAFEAVLDRDGAVFLAHEGSTTVSIDAAPPANARIDVIWVKQFETRAPFADAVDGPQFGVLKGTVVASPVKRTDLPAGALEIGTVQVPAGATTTQSAGVIITTTVPYTTTAGAALPVRNIAERDARTETFAPGGEVYVISEKAIHTKDGAGWSDGTGVDTAGWSYHSKSPGKRVYYRFYDSWAGSAFGPAGGSNWSQARATIAPPTGRDWGDFLVSVNVWPQSTSQNATQAVILGYLSASQGTSPVSLLLYNPTSLNVANTFMGLRASITLTER